MTSVPKGLIAAVAVSLAAHGALLMARWPGSRSGPDSVPAPTWMSARLLSEMPPAEIDALSAPMPSTEHVEPPSTESTESTDRRTVITTPDLHPTVDDRPTTTPAPAPVVAAPPASSATLLPPAAVLATTRPPANTEPGVSTGPDRGPQLLDDIESDIARSAGNRGGSVTLRMVISDRGIVESAEVVRSVPPGLFDAAALAAVTKARFAPALRNGMAVREPVTFEFSIAPAGTGADASGRRY